MKSHRKPASGGRLQPVQWHLCRAAWPSKQQPTHSAAPVSLVQRCGLVLYAWLLHRAGSDARTVTVGQPICGGAAEGCRMAQYVRRCAQDGVDAPPEEDLPLEEADLDFEDEASDAGGDLSYAAMFAASALGRMAIDRPGSADGPGAQPAGQAGAHDPQVAAPDALRRRGADRAGSAEQPRQARALLPAQRSACVALAPGGLCDDAARPACALAVAGGP